MKYIPTKNQWKNWSLPSKASYLGVILAIVLFVIGTLITLYLNRYVKESDQPSAQEFIEWQKNNIFPTGPQTAKEKTAKKQEKLTLLYLYENDFSNLFRWKQDGAYIDREGLKIDIKATEYNDFQTQSKFIGFYIPATPKTFEIVATIPDNYKIYSSKGKISTEFSMHGLQPVNSNELKFSGRVFLYHESPIFESQKRKLYPFYEKHGLSPQFRGSEYLLQKESEKKH